MTQTYEEALSWLSQQPQFGMVMESLQVRRDELLALFHEAQTDFDLRVLSGKIQEVDGLLRELGA